MSRINPKTISFLALALLCVAACANATEYVAKMNGKNTVPPVNTKATGTCLVKVVNSTYAYGNVQVKNVHDSFMAHIHFGNKTTNGNIMLWTFNSTLNNGASMQPISGSYSYRFVIPANLIAQFETLAKAQNCYYNVHTLNPPSAATLIGLIRGQFRKVTRRRLF